MAAIASLADKTNLAAARPEQIVQAIFSVCAPEDVALAAMDAVSTVVGSEFIGQFQEYITAERRPQFPDSLKNAGGCVALIDCDKDAELALQTMERLGQTFTHNLKMVAVASRTDHEFLLKAMRAGCDDVIHRPIDKEQLAATLRRFQNGYGQLPLLTRGAGKLISFYGVKGGVGTTTMAVHLAIHLVKKHRKRVLLIDHKHELGHVAVHLGLKESVYYFDELLRNAERLDAELLAGFVMKHSSGLEVIPSPDSCARVPAGSAEAIARVMNYLRTRYDYILIDSSLEYVESFAAISSASDEVALVCTPDVAALRDLVRRVEHLNSVSGFSEKLRIVINRSTSDDAVSAKDIVAAVKFPIALAVPNYYAGLLRALNEGEPVSPLQRSPFTQVLAQWADRLTKDDSATLTAATTKKKFLFGF
jgi:pilus assembly protein CpaE